MTVGNLKSQFVGDVLTKLIESGDVNGVELALDTHTSTALISSMKQNKRKMTPDMAAHFIEVLNNPFLTLLLVHKFSDGRTAPLFNGQAIDSENRLALLIKAKQETKDGLDHMLEEKLLKKPEHVTEREREEVEHMVEEMEEAAWAILNASSKLKVDYKISSKKIADRLIRKHRAEGVVV